MEIKCCRCPSICGEEKPDLLTVPGVAAGGTRGQIARSEFIMSRRKIINARISIFLKAVLKLMYTKILKIFWIAISTNEVI